MEVMMLRLQNFSSPPLDLAGWRLHCIPRLSTIRSPPTAVRRLGFSRNYYCGNWRCLSTTSSTHSGLTSSLAANTTPPGASASPGLNPNTTPPGASASPGLNPNTTPPVASASPGLNPNTTPPVASASPGLNPNSWSWEAKDVNQLDMLIHRGLLLCVAHSLLWWIAGTAADKPLSILVGNQPLLVIPSIASLLYELKNIFLCLFTGCLLACFLVYFKVFLKSRGCGSTQKR